VPGLFLRITSHDARSWILFYRIGGRQRALTLATYPDIGPEDARELARKARGKVSKGIDPGTEKSAARESITFEALAAEYMQFARETEQAQLERR
jgi:hypothetical protein